MTFKDFPAPQPVALDVALSWTASPDWTYETKLDGKRALLSAGALHGRARRYPLPGKLPSALDGVTLDGELVGKTYFAFDVLETGGQDVRQWPLRARQRTLDALLRGCPDWIKAVPSARPGEAGGTYLRAVLAAGGEGIVAKHLGARYGKAWFKVKARPTFDVVVTSKAADRQSVAVGQYRNGALVPCGRVAVPSPHRFARIQPGSVLEVAAQGRTRNGAFREPSFVRLRDDKPETECTI